MLIERVMNALEHYHMPPHIVVDRSEAGWLLRQIDWRQRLSVPLERAMRIGGAGALAIALSLWLMPGSPDLLAFAPGRLVATLVLVAAAVAGFVMAERGVEHLVKFDFQRGVMLRIVRNARGGMRYLDPLPLDLVESVYVIRRHGDQPGASLVVRAIGQAEPVVIGSGPTAAVERLQRELSAQFRSRQNSQDEAQERRRRRAERPLPKLPVQVTRRVVLSALR